VICTQSDLSKPLHIEDIDSSSGLLIPFFDADTNVVYVAGKVIFIHTLLMENTGSENCRANSHWWKMCFCI